MSKARDLANAGTALTTVSATELGYLDGVTSAVQTQIDSKIGQSTAINPSTVTTKGDILVATGAGTIVRQGVGTDGQYLQADSTQADGVKWATIASGGTNFTLLNTGGTATTSGSSVTISGISGMDKLFIRVVGLSITGEYGNFYLRLNGDTGNNYTNNGQRFYGAINQFEEFNQNGVTEFAIGGKPEAASGTITGNMHLWGCNSSGIKTINYIGGGAGYYGQQFVLNGFYAGSSTISSVTVYTGGTFDAGTVFVYGSAN